MSDPQFQFDPNDPAFWQRRTPLRIVVRPFAPPAPAPDDRFVSDTIDDRVVPGDFIGGFDPNDWLVPATPFTFASGPTVSSADQPGWTASAPIGSANWPAFDWSGRSIPGSLLPTSPAPIFPKDLPALFGGGIRAAPAPVGLPGGGLLGGLSGLPAAGASPAAASGGLFPNPYEHVPTGGAPASVGGFAPLQFAPGTSGGWASPDATTSNGRGPPGPARAGPRQGSRQDQVARPNAFDDIVRSAPAAVLSSAAGFFGGGGDLRELGNSIDGRLPAAMAPYAGALGHAALGALRGADLAVRLGPTSNRIESAVQNVTGPLYQPQTPAGKTFKTVAEFAPYVIGGPEGLATRVLTRAVLPGIGSELAGEATQGTPYEPYARIAGAAIGGLPALLKRIPGASTIRQNSVWKLPPVIRGRVIEKLFGHNLHPNFPTIDIWEPKTGAAISIKSVDLRMRAYQEEREMFNKLSDHVYKLAEFEGGRYSADAVNKSNIASRTLKLVVPSSGTFEQRSALKRLIDLGSLNGVKVRVVIYP